MINIHRDNLIVYITVNLPVLNTNFYFGYTCPNEWSAKLLDAALTKALAERIRAVREEEYYAGMKDARGKKDLRRDWFDSGLGLGVKK
jgi:hypothetical protein